MSGEGEACNAPWSDLRTDAKDELERAFNALPRPSRSPAVGVQHTCQVADAKASARSRLSTTIGAVYGVLLTGSRPDASWRCHDEAHTCGPLRGHPARAGDPAVAGTGVGRHGLRGRSGSAPAASLAIPRGCREHPHGCTVVAECVCRSGRGPHCWRSVDGRRPYRAFLRKFLLGGWRHCRSAARPSLA
jgi:hypothetical protein